MLNYREKNNKVPDEIEDWKQQYVNYYDQENLHEGDNPTIGNIMYGKK